MLQRVTIDFIGFAAVGLFAIAVFLIVGGG